MKIGVIGCGVVGGTLADWLENAKHEVFKFDPGLNLAQDLRGCEAIFVCVPVPTDSNGKQNEKVLIESIALARAANCEAKVFIRSSVLPGTSDKYGCISMPEFLTERQAKEDMSCLPILVGEEGWSIARLIFPDRPLVVMKNKECELAKYVHNVFGAMKVTYFNIVKHLCSDLNLSYAEVLKGASMTGFIEKTHTQVPGPDGQHGYGGKCFPKDVRAFAAFVDKAIGESPLITAIDWENDYYRNYFLDSNSKTLYADAGVILDKEKADRLCELL